MKLIVKCTVSEESASTKEILIRNPAATLSNLRAAIAINFRIPVYSFRMQHNTVDFSCEKIFLRDSGIQDGDLITVIVKREREGDTEVQVQENPSKAEDTVTSLAPMTAATPLSYVTETCGKNGVGMGGGREEEEEEEETDEETGDENEDEDGAAELLSHILSTVPNLLTMRREFLANPAEMMRQIQERDPRLFELITANHQEFIDLVNNEDLVETLQQEQEEAQSIFFDEEGELDEEAEEALNTLMALQGGVDVTGEREEETREGGGSVSETQRYLERVTTEEEEAKIEMLMQLGFTRDQCKVAFFKAKRSLERAANLLFEDPPQL